ncbi:hypothetical protein LCGC14_2141360, partial [marine sediment metagenome]
FIHHQYTQRAMSTTSRCCGLPVVSVTVSSFTSSIYPVQVSSLPISPMVTDVPFFKFRNFQGVKDG